MADAIDVAEEVLLVTGPLDTFSLQKLVFYCQAYHVAKHDEPLFPDEIEAWVQGPVVRRLFNAHRRRRTLSTVGGAADHLSDRQRESIRTALSFYGGHSDKWLVSQTHTERPWLDAREGLKPREPGSNAITVEAIHAYFAPIFNDPEVEDALEAAETSPVFTVQELRARYRR